MKNNVRTKRSSWHVRQIPENLYCFISNLVEHCDKLSTVGNLGEKVFINLVSLSKNSKEESLFVDSARRIHKI